MLQSSFFSVIYLLYFTSPPIKKINDRHLGAQRLIQSAYELNIGWTKRRCLHFVISWISYFTFVFQELQVRIKHGSNDEMRKLLGKRTDWSGGQRGSVNGRAGINALCEQTREPLKVLASDKRMWDGLCDLWEGKYRLFVFNNRDKVVCESYWPLCLHINQSGAFTRVRHSLKARNRRERGKEYAFSRGHGHLIAHQLIVQHSSVNLTYSLMLCSSFDVWISFCLGSFAQRL